MRRFTFASTAVLAAAIDLGPGVAKNLAAKNGVMGGLHPNDRGHANFAAVIIPQVLTLLGSAR